MVSAPAPQELNNFFVRQDSLDSGSHRRCRCRDEPLSNAPEIDFDHFDIAGPIKAPVFLSYSRGGGRFEEVQGADQVGLQRVAMHDGIEKSFFKQKF